jgi:hypothetical protein
MKKALLLALALPFAGAASAQQYVVPPPPPPEVALAGPLDFCGEEFSMRLEPGERVSWSPNAYSVAGRYTVYSGDFSADIYRRREDGVPPPAAETTAVAGLPLSPVAFRRVFQMPTATARDAKGRERQLVSFGIRYFLHGLAETDTPLHLLGFHEDGNARFPFLDRIDPRPLAQRNCTPSRTDPALAGRVVQLPGGY